MLGRCNQCLPSVTGITAAVEYIGDHGGVDDLLDPGVASPMVEYWRRLESIGSRTHYLRADSTRLAAAECSVGGRRLRARIELQSARACRRVKASALVVEQTRRL